MNKIKNGVIALQIVEEKKIGGIMGIGRRGRERRTKMEKGRGKRTDTLQTDEVITRKEYIEREAALSAQNKSMNLAECRTRLERLSAADVVARDCYDKILAENDDMRAIIDTYGGLRNIQSAFVKLHEIETTDVRPVVRGIWIPIPCAMEDTNLFACSKCKYLMYVSNNYDEPNYCPNCGARMDGDGDGV